MSSTPYDFHGIFLDLWYVVNRSHYRKGLEIPKTLGEVDEMEMKQAWAFSSECDLTQSHQVDPFYDHERNVFEYRRKMAFQQNIALQMRSASISEVVPVVPHLHAPVKSGSQLRGRVVRTLVSITIAGMIASLAAVAVVLFVHTHDFTGSLRPVETSSTNAEILLTSSDAMTSTATMPVTTETWSTKTSTFIQYSRTKPTLYVTPVTPETGTGAKIATATPSAAMNTLATIPTQPDSTSDSWSTRGSSFTQLPQIEEACLEIPIAVCQDSLPYNASFFPNRFNLGETIRQCTHLYHQLIGDVRHEDCRSEVERLLCRIFFPPCLGTLNFDDFHPLPCRSLCEDIRSRCVMNASSSYSSSIRTWRNLCTPMPESENESICFRNSSTSPLADQHSPCSSVTCENGGICFHVKGRAICRCQAQFYGIRCQEEYEEPCDDYPCLNGGTCESHRFVFGSAAVLCRCPPGYEGIHCERGLSNIESTSLQPPLFTNGEINRGECHMIPPECRAVLPYNRSEGLVEASVTPFFTTWSLLEAYVACSPSAAKVLICATAYSSACEERGSTESSKPGPLPCREVCDRMKQDCEYAFAVLNLPHIMCHAFQSSSENPACLGMP